LVDTQGTWRLDDPIVWTPEVMRHLEDSENNIAWVFDHWIDRMLGGFVTEFAIDSNVSYSEEGCRIFKGL